MAARVVKLRTRADQLREDQAAQLRQLLASVPDLPSDAAGRITAAIDRATAATNGWTFVMLSPSDNERVVSWLIENSKSPQVAVRLWAKLFTHLCRDTGEIAQTRDELADQLGIRADEVSRIMGELERIGAISRRRRKVPGMRGPGQVLYFMNPRIATHLPGKARDKAQKDAPLLRLIEDHRAG